MTDPIRSALKRLLSAVLDGLGQDDHPMGWARVDDAIDAARAALAQPEPEAVDGPAVQSREPASVACEPSDEQAQQLFDSLRTPIYGRLTTDTQDRVVGHEPVRPGDFARAVLARFGHQPAPPAEGEVAEVAAWLRAYRDEEFGPLSDDPDARWITRAADLLEQRHPAPVPVAERLPGASHVYFEFVISDADNCTQAGGIAPTYAQALSEGRNYLAQYQQDGPHILELRRVEVLPLPSGEVE